MTDDKSPLDLKTLIKVRGSGLAEVLRIRLEDEGIQCIIEGGNQAGLSGVLPIRLLVRSSDLDRAKELIEQHESSDEDDE
jgi:hypothetical protein